MDFERDTFSIPLGDSSVASIILARAIKSLR
jgi:hypothetical protein